MTISAEDFKRALSRRASGVAVVTAKSGARVHGMTVSAFTEVSLDPPLVLVCADKASNTLPVIRSGGVFAICPSCSSAPTALKRWTTNIHCDSPSGTPPPGAALRLKCRRYRLMLSRPS